MLFLIVLLGLLGRFVLVVLSLLVLIRLVFLLVLLWILLLVVLLLIGGLVGFRRFVVVAAGFGWIVGLARSRTLALLIAGLAGGLVGGLIFAGFVRFLSLAWFVGFPRAFVGRRVLSGRTFALLISLLAAPLAAAAGVAAVFGFTLRL